MFRKQRYITVFIYLSACLITSNSFAQISIPDKPGELSVIKKDLFYLMGYQALSVVFMYNLPEGVTGWSRNEKDELGVRQWKRHVQNPGWDRDDWVINYVLHPYWGAAYYTRGRERGFSKADSFWISVLFSTVYEFAIESFMEEPSIQDLFVTPIGGTALGIYFEAIRNSIHNKAGPLSSRDKIILSLTDPLGAMNRTVNSWLGINNEQQAMTRIGISFLRAGNGFNSQGCRLLQMECGQKFNGAAITFRYLW